MRRLALLLLGLALCSIPAAELAAQKFPKCASCARDGRGRIARSAKAKREFIRMNPCPARQEPRAAKAASSRRTPHCPGYEVDHIVPLACGGPEASGDHPSNMQWLTQEQHREKTKRDARHTTGGQATCRR